MRQNLFNKIFEYIYFFYKIISILFKYALFNFDLNIDFFQLNDYEHNLNIKLLIIKIRKFLGIINYNDISVKFMILVTNK